MKIRNLIEFTVDMTNKNEEIVRIINVYLSAIPTIESKKDFLVRLSDKISHALEEME